MDRLTWLSRGLLSFVLSLVATPAVWVASHWLGSGIGWNESFGLAATARIVPTVWGFLSFTKS